MSNKCQLKAGPFYQCCCKCIYLRPVHYHCCTTPKPKRKPANGKTCVCSTRKGWACAGPEGDRIYDNWPLHSIGCECFKTKEQAKRDDAWNNKAAALLFYVEHPKAPGALERAVEAGNKLSFFPK